MTAARPTEDALAAGAAPLRQGSDSGAQGRGAFTGERPGWGDGFDYDYARHLTAYQQVRELVTAKRVLDAGCGEGFGTRTLADLASEVVGVDYSEAAIAACRRLWCEDTSASGRQHPANLGFECVDLTRPGGFNRRFDVVLCFQVLEHIREPLPFLRALADRLGPGGVLVLTTPNRLRTVSENPFHVREYTEPELRHELAAVFGEIAIRGIHGNDKVERFEQGRARAVQSILRFDPLGIRRLLPRSIVEFAFARLARVVRRRARAAGPAAATPITPEDFALRDGAVDEALDLVAICSAVRGHG